MLRGGKFFFVFLILVSSLHASVFAQTTTSAACQNEAICGSAPKEFVMLMDMSRDLLTAIKTLGTSSPYTGKPVSPNWFQGGSFIPPKQNLATQVGNSATQTWGFVTAITAIFTSPQDGGGTKSFFAGILVLFRNKIFGRDLATVQRMDAMLTQKRYELGIGGGRYTTVNEQNVKMFQQILQRYQDKGLLTSYAVNPGVKYSNIVALVGKTLSATKSFLSVNTTKQFATRNRGGVDGIKITFNDTAIKSMIAQYDCARGSNNVCSKNLNQFYKSIKKIGSGSADKIKNAGKTITDAMKRLKEATKSPWTASLKPKTTFNDKGAGKTFGAVGKAVSSGVQSLSSWRSATVADEQSKTSALDAARDAVDEQTTTAASNFSTFSQLMKNGVTPLFVAQQRDLDLADFAEVKDFSPMFASLSSKVDAIVQLLGNKDTQNTVIKDLGTACELQCSNVKKKCW